MNEIEKYIIGALITSPKNDKDIGFNSALITLLKGMANGIPLDMTKVHNANNDEDTVDMTIQHEMELHVQTRKKLRRAIHKVNGDFGLSVKNEQLDELIAEVKGGNKLQAVKRLKEMGDLGLKEAKDCLDIIPTIRP